MEEKKKKNYVIPVIGALIAVVACVAYIVMNLHHNSNSLRTSGANMTTAVGCNFSK